MQQLLIYFYQNKARLTVFSFISLMLFSCAKKETPLPDFELAVQRHLAIIVSRNLDDYKKELSATEKLYVILPNGNSLTTPQDIIEFHDDWFSDTNWQFEGELVHKIVTDEMAMALVRYGYRNNPDDEPIQHWLSLVFRLEEGKWKLVHDQNTGINFSEPRGS